MRDAHVQVQAQEAHSSCGRQCSYNLLRLLRLLRLRLLRLLELELLRLLVLLVLLRFWPLRVWNRSPTLSLTCVQLAQTRREVDPEGTAVADSEVNAYFCAQSSGIPPCVARWSA
jgi:hypothetical protein